MRLAPRLAPAVVAALLAWPLPASAGPENPSQADRDAARTLAEKGFERYEAGDCPGAVKFFDEAEKRFHAPPHRLFVARCHAKLKQLLAARAIFREVAKEALAPDAPPAFREAQTAAKAELEEVEVRLPSVEIVLPGEGRGAQVSIDGKVVPPAELGQPKQLDPGDHTIVALGPNATRFQRSVSLKDGGGTLRVEVSFGASAAASGSQGSTAELLGVVGISVGAGVLAIGAITGVVSLNKVAQLDDACPSQTNCPPSTQSTADEAKTMGTISTIAFITGGVVAAAGVTMLVWRPKIGSSRTGSTTAPSVRPHVALRAAPGALMVDGRF